MRLDDATIARNLMRQVQKAAGDRVETEVRTVITRPMWKAFLRFTGAPEGTEPTAWLGIKNTHRVYGSETIVIESEDMWSVSALIEEVQP